ncbi:MAG: ExeM/NucH family extracellular endonuclease [Woeseiaceae bacterium]|nr:ExeM/NucH family extracellular endonuclease [Woeseiaceae bacterium]
MRSLPFLFLVALAACSSGGNSSASTAPSGPDLTAIGDIQGSGATSPVADQPVTLEAVVTGDFQDNDDDTGRNLGGFYVQGASDGNPATSDGIFVFDGPSPATDVSPGDLVTVTGTVKEFFGETQIQADTVTVTGAGSVQPTVVNLPAGDFERYEGMLVVFPQTLTVSQLRFFERFGEMLLSEGGRKFAFTNLNAPSVAGYEAHQAVVEARRVLLDDGRRDQNPGTVLSVRNGDEVTGLTGVVRYSRGSGEFGTETYRLMPTIDPPFVTVNPRPGAPQVDGTIRVATFNVNNFFSTIDTGQDICGPASDASCRGADSALELERQLAKIVTVMTMMDADIVAMVELENNASASLAVIVDALNAAAGNAAWDFVDAGTIGGDSIKVGFIYKAGAIVPFGAHALLDNSVDPRFDDTRNRPVLAQTFDSVAGGERLTVLALHLKSKGSNCDLAGDPDVGDGQGNCSSTRSLAAAAIIDWIDTDPTGSGDPDFLVIGDFNTYTQGDAMTRFQSAGYANLGAAMIGDSAYSFEFRGQFGTLDHAVATPSLAGQAVDAVEWHINADEAPLHDYNLEFGRDPDIFDPASPHRASDHDPLIIGIDLR